MYQYLAIAGLFAGLPTHVQAFAVERDAPTSFGPLKFNSNGTFHINILEDLHFGNSTKYKSPLRCLFLFLIICGRQYKG